jgi:hypothetical protein
MEYSANGQHFSYTTLGERRWGQAVRMLDHAVDLTAGKPWHIDGFTIQRLFDDDTFRQFSQNVRTLLINRWKQAGLDIDDHFSLDQYHTVAQARSMHLAAVEQTKLLTVTDFPIDITLLEKRISEICETALITKNPFDGQRIFHFRVIRPGKTDNNPLHRDVWLEDYDDCINLYIPIAGSSALTSLMIIPGSHLWLESKVERTVLGADINNVKFNVPAVTSIKDTFSVVRPSPAMNEVLVFSPYLIHGGSVNSSKDQTRISIEIRLWKV